MHRELHELTDEALVQLCRERGDRDDRAFAELFRRHHRMVWSLCRRSFPRAGDAEDLTQETFVRAFQGLANFAGRAAFSSWLYRIALNVCMNERRRRTTRPQEDPRFLVETAVDLPAPGPSAEEGMRTQDDIGLLSRAFATLSDAEREILRLVELQELSIKEVAERLGIGRSAAKMRVLRARVALRQTIDRLREETTT